MSYSAQDIQAARRHLRRSDVVMRRLIERVGPCTMRLKRDRFYALALSIVAQQISGSAARTIWARLKEAAGPDGVTPDSLAGFTREQFRRLGVSRQKAEYITDLASRVSSGQLVLGSLGRLDDEAIIERLTEVKGIGRWTAQMFLIFSLGRMDVLPVGDFGVRSAVKLHYELPDLPAPDQLHEIARPWRPYATVASWYLWQSLAVK